MIKKVCVSLQIVCLLAFLFGEIKIPSGEILFWKDLNICADEFKRLKLLLLGMKGFTCEPAIADPLKLNSLWKFYFNSE